MKDPAAVGGNQKDFANEKGGNGAAVFLLCKNNTLRENSRVTGWRNNHVEKSLTDSGSVCYTGPGSERSWCGEVPRTATRCC